MLPVSDRRVKLTVLDKCQLLPPNDNEIQQQLEYLQQNDKTEQR